MPRSRSPSPYRKTEKSRRLRRSHTKSRERSSPTESYRKSSRRSSRSRSPSKSKKNKRYRSAERRSRRSRSTSAKLRRQSRSPRSSKYYSSNSSSRKSRSHRQRPSRSSSSSSTSSSKSNSPAEERYIPLTKSKEPKKSKVLPPSPPVGIFDSVNMLLDEPMMPETLDLINADEFVAKTFTSTKKVMDKVVIDLTGETISVPVVDAVMEVNSIFHPNLFADDSTRMEKYVKKLFNYRQKMFYGN